MRTHLASLVEDFRRHGNQTAIALHRGNRTYRTTYIELATLAARFATELQHRNIAPGERVILWGESSAEWVAAFFGCLLRGIVAVPLDAAGSLEFATHVVTDTTPKLIVGDATLLSTLNSTTPQLSFSNFQQTLPQHPLFEPSPEITPDTPFQIVFTSGTTSEPKGIVHTHRNVLASLTPIETEMQKYLKYERLFHPLRFLHTLPLSHVFGQFMGLYIPALLAAELHFDIHLEPAHMVEEIRRERITVLIAVPRVLHLLRAYVINRFPELNLKLEPSQRLPAWKRWWTFRRIHRAFGLKFWAFICGGATLPPDLEAFWNTLNFALIQGYGLTETAALVTLNHPFRIGRGTIGKILPGRELRLENGEILVRGDMLSPATWQHGTMQPRQQEWLATGDLAERDAKGELRFVGRKGDVIVTASGMKIHPADLEKAVADQPGVRYCAVVPCDITAGPEPVAVVLFNGSATELQTAISRANQQLAAFQQIRHVLRWPEPNLPYTSTGKLLRRKVSDWACATLTNRNQSPNAINGTPNDTLLTLIASVTGQTVTSNDDSQRLSEDLHLDSLGRVQLQSLLDQQLGVELSDDAIPQIETLGQLRNLISRAPAGYTTPLPKPTDLTQQPATSPQNLQQPSTPDTDEHIYPHWPWAKPIQILRILFVELVLRPLIWLLTAPKIVCDFTTLPDGPFLLIANHVTAYDGALVLYALPPPLRRRIAIAMSGEMLLDYRKARNQGSWYQNALAPLAYLILTALFDTFPLPSLRGFRRSFAHAGEALDRNYSVLVFPEGQRSSTGELQPFRPGIGILAHDSQVPVLPIALIGLGEMRKTGHWLRSGHLTIHVGSPIAITETTDPATLTLQLHKAVANLVGQAASS